MIKKYKLIINKIQNVSIIKYFYKIATPIDLQLEEK